MKQRRPNGFAVMGRRHVTFAHHFVSRGELKFTAHGVSSVWPSRSSHVCLPYYVILYIRKSMDENGCSHPCHDRALKFVHSNMLHNSTVSEHSSTSENVC